MVEEKHVLTVTALVLLVAAFGHQARGAGYDGILLLARDRGDVDVVCVTDKPARCALLLAEVSKPGQSRFLPGPSVRGRTHRFPLTGLAPGRRYTYSLLLDGVSQGSRTFSVSGPDRVVAGVLGAPRAGPALLSLTAALLSAGPDLFVLADGPVGAKGTDNRLRSSLGEIWASCPTWIAPLSRAFLLPGEGESLPTKASGIRALTTGPVLFVGIPNHLPTGRAILLAGDLRKVLGRSSSPHRVAVIPRPLFSSGPRGCDRSLRRAVLRVLLEGGVSLILSGGDRLYERTRPTTLEGSRGHVVQVVTGGGGAPLERARPAYWSKVVSSAHHFLVLDADGKRLAVEARDGRGTLFDRFVLPAHDPASSGPEGGVALLRASLTEGERALMKEVEEACRSLEAGLARKAPLGLAHRAGRLRRRADEMAAWKKGRVFAREAAFLAREAGQLQSAGFERLTARILAETRLAEIRRICHRCHGLHE